MNGNSKFLFFNCSELAKCCDKAQYDEASFKEKIMIHLHNIMCKPCRDYTSKNIKLTRLIKKSRLKTCSEKEKENWKKEIEESFKE